MKNSKKANEKWFRRVGPLLCLSLMGVSVFAFWGSPVWGISSSGQSSVRVVAPIIIMGTVEIEWGDVVLPELLA